MSDPVQDKKARLPRKSRAVIAGIEPGRKLTTKGPLANVDLAAVLTRYLSDETTYEIAKSLGVTRQALSHHLLKNAEEQWKEAQVARAIARKEKAEDAMDAAQDPLALAKARELLKSAQWDLERTCRRIYGQHNPEVNLNVTVDLGERLRRARERTIDVTPVQSE